MTEDCCWKVSDADEELCARFDVIKMKNMYGETLRGIERSTFVIDAKGALAPFAPPRPQPWCVPLLPQQLWVLPCADHKSLCPRRILI